MFVMQFTDRHRKPYIETIRETPSLKIVQVKVIKGTNGQAINKKSLQKQRQPMSSEIKIN